MSKERRAYPRLECSLKIRYARGGKRVYSGQALNLSDNGARLVLDEAASSPLELQIELAGQIAVLASTVWAERLPSGHRLVGVRFEEVSLDHRRLLSGYLSELATGAA